MFKKKQSRKTIFNIPSDEAQKYLSSIIKDVEIVMKNEKFMEATHKVEVPENATIKDYENLVKRVAPVKIYKFLTDFDTYKKKSINEMCEDISSLSADEVVKVLRFFIH